MMKKTAIRKLLPVLVGLLVFGLIAGVLYGIERYTKGGGEPDKGALDVLREKEIVYFNDIPYVPKSDLKTLLVIGVDKDGEMKSSESYSNTSQSDFLLLVVMDTLKNEYTLLHINRDTMADIDQIAVNGQVVGTVNEQLALAHTYGDGMEISCENTVTAVSRFLYGVPIDHYFAMTLDALPIVNDYLGGVTVIVPQDLTAVDPALKLGAEVTLTGKQTELFVRARGSLEDSSNLARMERQKTYIDALIRTFAEKDLSDDDLLRAFDLTSPYMLSNLSVTAMSDLLKNLPAYRLARIVSPEGEAVLGRDFMEFHADEEALKDLVIDIFYTPAE